MEYKEALKYYDELISRHSEIERKGKTMPYTSANGYMFSLLNKAGEIGIRLPKEKQKEVIEKYDSGPFKSYGATMRDYVLMTKPLIDDPDTILDYLNQSFQYVKSLPPNKHKKK